MKNQKFKPLFDKTYKGIWISLSVLMILFTFLAVLEPTALFVMIPTDLFVLYFLVSPLFGYVELREKSVFIRFGLILKREVPYQTIRGITKERKFYSDSMLALKNALEHINIKYNTFDVLSVSVADSEAFVQSLEKRITA
ncbi:MAG: PH domain-containing protein [Clostridia bacterium]|nr:PH domain-containing protein [Clostridia bacterium]